MKNRVILIALILAVFTVFSMASFAEEQGTPPGKPEASPNFSRQEGRPSDRPEGMMDLKLSEEQTIEIRKILLDFQKESVRLGSQIQIKQLELQELLMEPIVDMEVTIPAENVGDITGDLASKRGRVQGQDVLAGNFIVIIAQVPLAEVTQYNSQLKSVTGGRGSYSMTLSHYELVPPNVQQQIVAQYAKKKEED